MWGIKNGITTGCFILIGHAEHVGKEAENAAENEVNLNIAHMWHIKKELQLDALFS